MQLQQLSLLTVNNKKNTWASGGEERSENALCVLRRCCLDELLSAQRAQSSSHASLQLPPPGGGGRKKRRNVVVVTRLLENRLMFVGDVRLSYSSKASQTLDGKTFLYFSSNYSLALKVLLEDRWPMMTIHSNPALIAQNYSWRTRTTSNVQRWTEIWTKYELCRAKTERQYDRKTERQKDCTCTWKSCELFQ